MYRKTYNGISSTKWKIRYANHKYSFSHEHLKHQRDLSKQFWSLKNKGLTPEIQLSILKKKILENVLMVDVNYAKRKEYK